MISRRQFGRFLTSGLFSIGNLRLDALLSTIAGQANPSNAQTELMLPSEYRTKSAVRYTTEVGGFFRAIQLFKRFQRAEDQQDLRRNCDRRKEALATELQFLENYLKHTNGQSDPRKTMAAHETLAQFLAYKGD